MQLSTYVTVAYHISLSILMNEMLQTRWYLCGVDDWRSGDGEVKKQVFYNTIINLFKNKNMKDWSEALLCEWNRCVVISPSDLILTYSSEMFQNKKKYEARSASLSALYEQCRLRSLALMPPAPASNATDNASSRVSHHSSLPAAAGTSRRSSSPTSIRTSRWSTRASRHLSPSVATRAARRSSPPAPARASRAYSPPTAARTLRHASPPATVRHSRQSLSPASVRAPRQSARASRASSPHASVRASRRSTRASRPSSTLVAASASHQSASPAAARSTSRSVSQLPPTLSANINSRPTTPTATTSKRCATSPDSPTFPSAARKRISATPSQRSSKRHHGS
jgi:hypothetical protein